MTTTNWAEIDAQLAAEHAACMADRDLRESAERGLPILRAKYTQQRVAVEGLSMPERMKWATGGEAEYLRELGLERAIEVLCLLTGRLKRSSCTAWLTRADVDRALMLANEAR